MTKIYNLNGKRVCDLSPNKSAVIIQQKDCIVIIAAKSDGTLKITHKRIPPMA